jgi:FixJ family two-component response regulator
MISRPNFPHPTRVRLIDDQDIVRRALALFITSQSWKAFAYDSEADVVALLVGTILTSSPTIE